MIRPQDLLFFVYKNELNIYLEPKEYEKIIEVRKKY